MRIGINTRLLLPKGHPEGLGRFTYELTSRMAINHPEVEFIFFFDRPFNPKFVYSKNVTPVVIPLQARHPVLFYLWYEWLLPYYLKKYKIDIFFSPDNFLSLSTKVTQVLAVHDLAYIHLPETLPSLIKKYYHYFMPKYVKKADCIVTVSDHSKKDILNNFPFLEDSKIKTIYSALPSGFKETHQFEKIEITDPYFIVVGSINPRKNTLRILQAIDLVKTNKKFKVVFAGRFMWKSDGELNDIWQRLIQEDKIVHVENATDSQIINYISQSQALLYPSLFEGFGLPILEGMACGVPVITSNTSSMPEVAGGAAILVDPFKPDEIASAIQSIINEEIDREVMVEKGLKRAKDFSWDNIAIELFSILEAEYKSKSRQ